MVPAKEKTNPLFSHPRQTTHGARRAEREDDRMLKVAPCLLKQIRDRALDRALCNALVLHGQHISTLQRVWTIWLQCHTQVAWESFSLALLQQKAGGMLGATDTHISRTWSATDLKKEEICPHEISPAPA